MHRPELKNCRFYRKESLIFERERERGGGVIYGNGVSYKLGSYLESQNPKASFGSARAPTTTAAPRLHRSSPKFCQSKRTPTPTKPTNGFERTQAEIERTTKAQGGVFRTSPQEGEGKVVGTPHSGHETDSKLKHSNHPPPGNKTPNCRAADRGKKRRERGGRRRTGRGEGKEGLGPLRSERAPKGKRERERGGP